MAILQADGVSVKVVEGDTLSEIAVEYADKIAGGSLNARVDTLVKLNNIKDRNLIYVGQIIKLSGEATADKTNTTSKPTITAFGLQAGTADSGKGTLFAIWTWDKENTDNYQTIWYYTTGNKDRDGNIIWFIGSDSTTDDKQSTYSIPNNATHVKFKVKPNSKKRTVNNTETTYWTANWSTVEKYDVADNPPTKPGKPDVTIEKYKLTAKLENLDVNAPEIQFQIVKDDSKVFNTGTAKIVTGVASYSCNVDAGGQYKVRCRSVRDKMYSDWSDYSNNANTIPAAPSGITTIRANDETSVYLEWKAVSSAEAYELEYTTKKMYFDASDQVSSVRDIENTHWIVTGLEGGQEYFFRVRAVNKQGESSWSDIKSVVVGSAPAAPTTWSSTTTAVIGEPVTLYWVHNSEDGSSQTYADLELYVDGTKYTYTIKNSTEEDEKDKTSFYVVDDSTYPDLVDGGKVTWRVRTAGITKEYGDWSIERTIDIYAPATLELDITDVNGNDIEVLEQFPFYIRALPGPNTQAPISYHLEIVSNEVYETTDRVGNEKIVNIGEAVYSKHFDITDALRVEMSASNIDLENNVEYTVNCTVSMNSGLTKTESKTFTVAWTDQEYEPNAEIGIDADTYTASIRPFCEDENGNPIADILLSVYRREFDGSFVEIATGIVNGSNTFVTDPHPSLDLARYRIVATTESTGAVSYCDIPGYPVGSKAAIIQWDEEWSNFDVTDESEMEQPPWSGSMLKLLGNIDVSESNQADVARVDYIGREHPVAYYGTQVGHKANWSMAIPKSDKETLYALRRLQRWMGDVYVREPSGSGYWASITVSFSQTHKGVTIPVTMEITRVEGGV